MELASERRMHRLLTPLVLVLLLGSVAPAQAVTLRDLIDLSRSGLSDDILIALVEAEQSVFRLDAVDIQQLKQQGLSDRLLVHLLQTPALRAEAVRHGHVVPAPALAPAPVVRHEPDVVVIDRVETIAVPVYIPVVVPRHKGRSPDSVERGRKPAAPVYWGYGGKRRPDAWKER
jgi:hypothetical protein